MSTSATARIPSAAAATDRSGGQAAPVRRGAGPDLPLYAGVDQFEIEDGDRLRVRRRMHGQRQQPGRHEAIRSRMRKVKRPRIGQI